MKNQKVTQIRTSRYQSDVHCPICGKRLVLTFMGIRSHLKKHVREKKITVKESIVIKQLLLERKPIKNKPLLEIIEMCREEE